MHRRRSVAHCLSDGSCQETGPLAPTRQDTAKAPLPLLARRNVGNRASILSRSRSAVGRERQIGGSSYRLVPRRSNLHPAITWSKEIPQNQTQQRQEHHY